MIAAPPVSESESEEHMDSSWEWPAVLWRFLLFLPFFLGLFLLGALKGIIVLPIGLAILSIGNSVVLVGLWPAQFFWMYYNLARTRKLGPVLKLVLFLILPVPFIVALVFGIAGSALVGLGYGFLTPLVATFEAVREGRQDKFVHCFTDGIWDTVKGSCTVVRDFTDCCYHSYFSYLEDFSQEPLESFQPYEIKLLDLPGCAIVGLLAVIFDVPCITLVAIVKSPYMLLRGWRRLLQDLVGREGPFLETVCVPVAGLAIVLWPLVVVVAVISAFLSSFFIGLYGAVIVYQESSVRCGFAYILAVVAQFDEYTNDLVYLHEGSCFPRPRYRQNSASDSGNFSIRSSTMWQWTGRDARSPIPTLRSSGSINSRSSADFSVGHSRSLRQTLQEVKMVQIWDNIFKTCELVGKELVQADIIKFGDLEEWNRAPNSEKSRLVGVGLPAYAVLTCLLRSAKAGVTGLLLIDGVEVTMLNCPQDHLVDWFFEPLVVLKEQIKGAKLQESEELYLKKWVLTSGDLARMNDWQNGGLAPADDVRRGELLAWSRRIQGITTSISRLPTFRRRYQAIIRLFISVAQENSGASPLRKSKGSPTTSDTSSEGSVTYGKPQTARLSEPTLQRVTSPGKNLGGSRRGYYTVEGNDNV